MAGLRHRGYDLPPGRLGTSHEPLASKIPPPTLTLPLSDPGVAWFRTRT